MINPKHFREYVVRPVLMQLEPEIPYSKAAENLLVGTAAHESKLTYLRQLGGGPAMGLYQMEPNTHVDIWDNYLAYNEALSSKVRSFASQRWPATGLHEELITNLAYATAMARVHYWRQPQPMPDADDLTALSGYWKRWYNTYKGAGTTFQFIKHYPEEH